MGLIQICLLGSFLLDPIEGAKLFCDTTALDMIDRINLHRELHGEPRIKASPSLCFVAQTHAEDFDINIYPYNDPRCKDNSWSCKGAWTCGCVERNATTRSQISSDKPRELTEYTGRVNELAGSTGPNTNKAKILARWLGNDAFNDILLRNSSVAIGYGYQDAFHSLWIGEEVDETEVEYPSVLSMLDPLEYPLVAFWAILCVYILSKPVLTILKNSNSFALQLYGSKLLILHYSGVILMISAGIFAYPSDCGKVACLLQHILLPLGIFFATLPFMAILYCVKQETRRREKNMIQNYVVVLHENEALKVFGILLIFPVAIVIIWITVSPYEVHVVDDYRDCKISAQGSIFLYLLGFYCVLLLLLTSDMKARNHLFSLDLRAQRVFTHIYQMMINTLTYLGFWVSFLIYTRIVTHSKADRAFVNIPVYLIIQLAFFTSVNNFYTELSSHMIKTLDFTAIHAASWRGDIVKINKYLGSRTQQIHALTKDQNTPLHFAAAAGHLDIVKLLLENSATIDALNKCQSTPLWYAASHGHMDTVLHLLFAGANGNIANERGFTPLEALSAIRRYDNLVDKNKVDTATEFLKRRFAVYQSIFINFKQFSNVAELSSGNFGITFRADFALRPQNHKIDLYDDSSASEAVSSFSLRDNIHWLGRVFAEREKKEKDPEEIFFSGSIPLLEPISIPVAGKIPKQQPSQDEWHELDVLQNVPISTSVLGLVGLCMDFKTPTKSNPLRKQTDVCFVVPFKHGGGLDKFIWKQAVQGKFYTLQEMAKLGIDMVDGLDFLHNSGYIHNDVAARNFLRTEEDDNENQKIILADFGMSRDAKNEDPLNSISPWNAPETMIDFDPPRHGTRVYNAKSDVFMLGITFWELVAIDRKPFGISVRQMYSLGKGVELAFKKYYPVRDTPPDWKTLVEYCCDRDPEKRPSLEKVRSELETILKKVLLFVTYFVETVDEPSKHSALEDSKQEEYDQLDPGYEDENSEDVYEHWNIQDDVYSDFEPIASTRESKEQHRDECHFGPNNDSDVCSLLLCRRHLTKYSKILQDDLYSSNDAEIELTEYDTDLNEV